MLVMEKQYLSVEEVANELGVSTDLVFKWLNDKDEHKRLIGYKLARNVWRIKRTDLSQFLEARKNTKPEE